MTSRRFYWIKRALMAGVSTIAVAASAMAAEDDPKAASPAAQARLERAEHLLDGWAGQGDAVDDAQAALDSVLRAEPDAPNAHRLYARVHLIRSGGGDSKAEARAFAAAEEALARALQLKPDYARAYVLQGHLFVQMGQHGKATAALEQADRLGTTDPWLDLNWAELLMAQGQFEAAAARYRKVARAKPTPRTTRAALLGMIDYHQKLRSMDDLDAAHRALIAHEPTRAWSHGNYAIFLLCWGEDAQGAIAAVSKASALMDYPSARLVHAAALHSQWAALALDGNKLSDEPAAAARRLLTVDPAVAVHATCGVGTVLMPVLEAMLLTGEGERTPAQVAGVLAADAGERGAPGVFELKVQATGRQGDRIYLNSEADYRDPRNLSLVFGPKAAEAFEREHGSPPDQHLEGKTIHVSGLARKVKIYFLNNGMPTEKYYFQTQLGVSKSSQVKVVEPEGDGG